MIESGEIAMVINTPVGSRSVEDEKAIRMAAICKKVPCVTTMSGFHALVLGLLSLPPTGEKDLSIRSLQSAAQGIA